MTRFLKPCQALWLFCIALKPLCFASCGGLPLLAFAAALEAAKPSTVAQLFAGPEKNFSGALPKRAAS
jgi:hypothetical protein